MNFSLRPKIDPRSDCGSSLIETAFLTPFLLLLLLGVIDFGRAYYLSSEVVGAAHAAALYATGNPNDNTGITNAATSDAPNVSGLTVATISVGCECSDGTGFSANCSSSPTTCSANVVSRVSVTVNATYTTWFPWPGIPNSIAFTQTATMRTGA